MSEAFATSRASIARLKAAWKEADEDTRWDIGFWATGLTLMAIAIVAQFGWIGSLFCFGFIVWVSANKALTRT